MEPEGQKADLSRRSLATERWQILRSAILASRYGQNRQGMQVEQNLASVRRFSSFRLFSVTELSQDETQKLRSSLQAPIDGYGKTSCRCDTGRWLEYKYGDVCGRCSVNAVVKYIIESASLEAMIGFNNTGNVCVWPSEEILAYYCLKQVEIFRETAVCELGCGMTALAGIMLASSQSPSEILLTDGNGTSVENVKEIISANSTKFGHTRVLAEVLVWDNSFLRSVSPHDARFDYIICADCLFFEEVHNELVQVMLKLLKPNGTVILFAPKRSGTLDRFCTIAKQKFAVKINHQYDALIWEKHESAVKDSSTRGYTPDLHYPLQLILQPL